MTECNIHEFTNQTEFIVTKVESNFFIEIEKENLLEVLK